MSTITDIQKEVIAMDSSIGELIRVINIKSEGKLYSVMDDINVPTFGNMIDMVNIFEQNLSYDNMKKILMRYQEVDDYKNYMIQLSTASLIYKRWSDSKIVYECDPFFVERLMSSENTEIHLELFDRLPTHTFAIYCKYSNWSMRYVNIYRSIDNFDYGNGEKPGRDCVHIEICNTESSDGFDYSSRSCNIYENDNLDDRVDKIINFVYGTTFESKFSEYSEEDQKEIRDRYKNELKFVILVSYYMATQNAIIRHKQIKKTQRLKKSNGIPLNINYNQLGIYRGLDFKSYDIKRINESSGDSEKKEGKTGREMTPHLRRAHWHHYWVGAKGDPNRYRVLKWIDPIFVNQGKINNSPIVVRRI